jgi:hypothetical protein
MTFICPICHEISSGKHNKQIPKKTGKTWRERQMERAPMPTAALGYHCPCCKELRTMEQYNPFETWKAFGKKKKEKTIPPLKKVHKVKTSPKKNKQEITATTAEGLALSSGLSTKELAGYRTLNRASGKVSWNDATEMRRLILKNIVMKSVMKYVVIIQCCIRSFIARRRVKKIRDSKRKTQKINKASSQSSFINGSQPNNHSPKGGISSRQTSVY